MSGDDTLFGDEEGAPSGFFDDVAAAGERRGIGRPKGARNRKSVDFEKLYYAKGYRDPLLVLGEIISADPRSLQAMAVEQAAQLGLVKVRGSGESAIEVIEVPTLLEVLDMQRKAAIDLAPYLHGKKPTQIELVDERLPTLIVVTNDNQLAEAQRLLQQREALSLGRPIIDGEVVENAGVSDDEG